MDAATEAAFQRFMQLKGRKTREEEHHTSSVGTDPVLAEAARLMKVEAARRKRKHNKLKRVPRSVPASQSAPAPSRDKTRSDGGKRVKSTKRTRGGKDTRHKQRTPLVYKPDNLTASQLYAVKAIIEHRRNIFLTGAGGCGKTHVIDCVRRNAEQLGLRAVVTAPTGTAATYVNGKTLHTFAKLPIPKHSGGLTEAERSAYMARIKEDKGLYWSLRRVDILMIDEISMVTSDTMHLLDDALRTVRENHSIFGGVIIMVIGDMLQIAPVQHGASREVPPLIIQNRNFAKWFPITVLLSKNFRMQSPADASVLEELRMGDLSQASTALLESRGMELCGTGHDPVFQVPHLDVLARATRQAVRRRRGTDGTDEKKGGEETDETKVDVTGVGDTEKVSNTDKVKATADEYHLRRTHIMGTRKRVRQHNDGLHRILSADDEACHCEQPLRFSTWIKRNPWRREHVQPGDESYMAFRRAHRRSRATEADVRALQGENIFTIGYEQGPESKAALSLIKRVNMTRGDRQLGCGMRVVLTSNMCLSAPYHLANGSFGTILGFATASDDGLFTGRRSMNVMRTRAKARISAKKRAAAKKSAERSAANVTTCDDGSSDDEDDAKKDDEAGTKKEEPECEPDPNVMVMDELAALAKCIGAGLEESNGNPIVEFDNGVILVVPDLSLPSDDIGSITVTVNPKVTKRGSGSGSGARGAGAGSGGARGSRGSRGSGGADASSVACTKKQSLSLSLTYCPLRPAAAVTCHRAQAQTLPFGVAVYLLDMFQPGQCYVALSRAKSIQPGPDGKGGIVVYGEREEDGRVNYGLHNVKAHPYAKSFYEILNRATDRDREHWRPEVADTRKLIQAASRTMHSEVRAIRQREADKRATRMSTAWDCSATVQDAAAFLQKKSEDKKAKRQRGKRRRL